MKDFVTFRGDINAIHRLTKDIKLSEQVAKKATVSAINKSITSTRAFAVKLVAKDYKISQKVVRDELKLVKANYSSMEAKIIGSGSPGIPLYKFAPTPKKVPSTRRLKSGGYTPKGGIKVMIRKGARKTVQGAFIAQMSSGHIGVFKRKKSGPGQAGKQGIDELFGPSPLRILDDDRYYQQLDDFTEETMDKNYAREVDFYLKKAGVFKNA